MVGKEQFAPARRTGSGVDRYFEGPAEDPKSVTQPLACVHREMAPCEYVCPVNATVHPDEGLNEMVYNRCVGTLSLEQLPVQGAALQLLRLPRGRRADAPDAHEPGRHGARTRRHGEVHLPHAAHPARAHRRAGGRKKIGPDEVVPACAQACPAEAITFGNLNDPGSRVSRKHGDARRYDLLHELGTRPRTAYLVKLATRTPSSHEHRREDHRRGPGPRGCAGPRAARRSRPHREPPRAGPRADAQGFVVLRRRSAG